MLEDLRAAAAEAIVASTAPADPDYPLFHVAPPVGRLNDPNGLVVVDGRFHAFYQFSPFHPHRKLVYWGHASSTDLTHWDDHGAALTPENWYDRNGVYSGSALIEDGQVLFHYTGNVRTPEGGRDTYQCLATSVDLAELTKSAENPIIPTVPLGYTAHVRDPQVWRDDDGSFRMCLGAQRSDETGCVLLYRSRDLRSWWFEGELCFPDAGGRFDAFGYMWECPSIVRVPDAQGGQPHDVLVFCPQGAPAVGEGFANVFPCGYVIGRLMGTDLVDVGEFHELDRGFEFYAPQVFARAQDEPGPPLLMAWIGNAGEDDQPSVEHGWVHTLSVAREISVRDGRLVQQPRLAGRAPQDLVLAGARLVNTETSLDALAGSRAFRLQLQLGLTQAAGWALRIGTDDSHIDLRAIGRTLVVDRTASRYPHGERRTVTLPETEALDLELFHDRSVTEVFLAGGSLSISLRSYLDADATGVELAAAGVVDVHVARAARFD